MTNNKDNKKKNIGSSSVLVQLYNNRKVRSKVDMMLDEGQTYDYIIEFCKDNDLSISKASLTNYKKKREESIETGKPLLPLLDKRAKDNVAYIADKERTPQKNFADSQPSSPAQIHDIDKVDTVFNDLELLDELIRKGFKGVKHFDVVDAPLALKALELKAKITNNQLGGMSIAGLREIRLRQHAKESAFMEVIMKYVPEAQQDQLLIDLEEAEKQFYENLDLTEEDKRLNKAIQQSGLGF
ncbi:hypothetical protein LD13_gp056 [Bacillus phage Bobb]|uniref:Uncharacterized protein n=1 Tax=Bacillus phage Bobb TaxID=1527469 RepID=A0A076G6P9_9CAUD|nr:hypothetical protein LD13_gp056 [Bacillus phage Bobb]AII27957.1 hypothetical protein [Bacillus phage Bobb]